MTNSIPAPAMQEAVKALRDLRFGVEMDRRNLDDGDAKIRALDAAIEVLSKLRADGVPSAQPAFWIDLEPISGSQNLLIRQWQNIGALGPGKHTLFLSPAADQASAPVAGEARPTDDEIMTKVQEFASTWAIVDGRFDDGSAMERAEQCKEEIKGLLSRRAAPQASETATAAARDVLAERQRQITAEGFGTSRDDLYTQGELADAAACYAAHHTTRDPGYVSLLWPWPAAWWKPSTYRRSLAKAGALILAEIERLDRVAPPAQPVEKKDGGDCAKGAGDERQAWQADMIAAGAQHLGGDCWEWDVPDFEFRLWQLAARRQQRAALSAQPRAQRTGGGDAE